MENILRFLTEYNLPAEGLAGKLTATKWLVRWGAAADPTALSPNSVWYIKTDGVAINTILYVNVNGTYTLLTVS